MKTIHVAAFALNAALYVALGILVSTILPLNFGGVRFWPQVIVPAVFAAVFGPWVGGLGAATGIFISDILLGGSPLLSLMAGVTSNFLGFWLVGYIANKKFALKKSTAIYGGLTAISAVVAFVYTNLIYVGIIVGCFVVYLAVVLSRSKWVNYELGCVVGLLVGSLIIGVTVPVYAVLFAPTSTAYPALTAAGILALFTWTFATEIPFMLVLGPPIIGAIYKAFPTLKKKNIPTLQSEST
ncbi:MAG: ECF transporter S component [Candidatus Bathyarchaeota archaeon]|nr:ECF transporter S component [Candidatus Bathyarchaeota archaeon]